MREYSDTKCAMQPYLGPDLSTMTSAPLNVVSVFCSRLFNKPFMTLVSPLKTGCTLRILPWVGRPGLSGSRRAGRLGWQNLHSWLITVAGPVALAVQKCFVKNAVRANTEESYLSFIHSGAGFIFSCDKTAELAYSPLSKSSWWAWVFPGKQK